MGTFMLLALFCAFLLGVTAGAWLTDITMRRRCVRQATVLLRATLQQRLAFRAKPQHQADMAKRGKQ
jgi:hypothetical protein